jgi:hypothetical protein
VAGRLLLQAGSIVLVLSISQLLLWPAAVACKLPVGTDVAAAACLLLAFLLLLPFHAAAAIAPY